MIYYGKVCNGVIVLDQAQSLPEGAQVRVDVVESNDGATSDAAPTLLERLGPFVGSVQDLPADASAQHDHYLYGTPKRP